MQTARHDVSAIAEANKEGPVGPGRRLAVDLGPNVDMAALKAKQAAVHDGPAIADANGERSVRQGRRYNVDLEDKLAAISKGGDKLEKLAALKEAGGDTSEARILLAQQAVPFTLPEKGK